MSQKSRAQNSNPKYALDMAQNQNQGPMSQYHQDLAKWAKNVDKRYAWVVLGALFMMMAAGLGVFRMYGLLFAKVTASGEYTRQEAFWPVAAITTVENVVGPFASIVAYHISYRQCMLIGFLLLVSGNSFAALSRNLILDVFLIGIVQGIGHSFIFMPFMEIINNYFLRYRNIALGFALCGGTLSVFVWSPIFQWMLEEFHWRISYYGLGAVCAIGLLMVPFLLPNPKPEKPDEEKARENAAKRAYGNTNGENNSLKGTFSRGTLRALTYQNSLRRQSTILISRQRNERQGSVVSVNPFASTAGLERKISRAITDNIQRVESSGKISLSNQLPIQQLQQQESDLEDTLSLSEFGKDKESELGMAVIWEVMKTPAFHFIWYNELIYFWVFSVYCLAIVDYGTDRGCTKEESETLLGFQSIGELIGRLGLTVLVDLKYMSNKNVVVLVLFIMAGNLILATQVWGYYWMGFITTAMSSFSSLLYILLNGLLVDYLGEQQVTLGYGMASFIGGVLMSFRPQALGYFRDNLGSYDPLMWCLAGCCAFGGLLWIVEPLITRCCGGKRAGKNPPSSMAEA